MVHRTNGGMQTFITQGAECAAGGFEPALDAAPR